MRAASASILQPLKFAFVFFLFLVSFSSHAQKIVPELWGQRVHDDAHMLKTETIDLLEKELKGYEDSTSNQIAILIVPSLDGDALEEYTLRVVEKWKLGTKEKDNGVLLFVAVDDHKMRIEVGHGLEGALTDARCNQIIRNEMAPAFRRSDYDGGIQAGIKAIVQSAKGEYQAESSTSFDNWTIVYILFAIFCVIVLIVTFVNEFRSKDSAASAQKGIKKVTSKKGKAKKNESSSWDLPMPDLSGSSKSSSSSSSSVFSSGSSFSGGGGSFGGGGSSGSW